jgi:hypothetical protein
MLPFLLEYIPSNDRSSAVNPKAELVQKKFIAISKVCSFGCFNTMPGEVGRETDAREFGNCIVEIPEKYKVVILNASTHVQYKMPTELPGVSGKKSSAMSD